MVNIKNNVSELNWEEFEWMWCGWGHHSLVNSDHIAIPDFSAGAMENWGLVTYLMRSLLYNAEESSAGDQQWVAVVVAHELAHQVSAVSSCASQSAWAGQQWTGGHRHKVLTIFIPPTVLIPTWKRMSMLIPKSCMYRYQLLSTGPVYLSVTELTRPFCLSKLLDIWLYK